MSDNLPGNIKFLRRKQGLTQEKLGDLLGTTRASVCAYEDGRAMPPYPKLKALAEVLESTVEDITELDLSKEKRVKNKAESQIVTLSERQTDRDGLIYSEEIPFAEYTDKKQGEVTSEAERWFESGADFPLKNCRILTRKIEPHEIADGSVYVLITKSAGVLYRRVYDQAELRGVLVLTPEVTHLQTLDLPVSEVREIWEFLAYQSSQPPRLPRAMHTVSRLLDEAKKAIEDPN